LQPGEKGDLPQGRRQRTLWRRGQGHGRHQGSRHRAPRHGYGTGAEIMAIRQSTFDGTFGISLFASTVIHLAVFLLLIWSGRLFPVSMPVQETYYVDVVNLPVASPRAG